MARPLRYGRHEPPMRGQTKPAACPPDEAWEPPFEFEEKLKYTLVPGALYIRYRAWKEWFKGEPEVRLLRYLVDPARNAVDVGANKGVYTYFLARCCRYVYAFEPNPKIFRILRRGTAWARNVTVSPVALSNRSGAGILRVPHHRGGFSNQGGSLSAVKVPDNYKAVRIEMACLDDLDIDDVGFLKIDVEGFEQEVLEGARETIARDRPVILVEMEGRFLDHSIEEAIRRVEDRGYRGLALLRGRLMDLSAFDGERNQRARTSRAEHVNNFIFLPNKGPAA